MSAPRSRRNAPDRTLRLFLRRLDGVFYPKGLAKSEFLRYYASKFPVEINATYYRIPPPRTFEAMAPASPPGFVFTAKANQDMTHARSPGDGPYTGASWRRSSPCARAGKFDGTLLQFPFGFKNDARSRGHLAFLREQLPGMRLWAEFRHESWDRPPVLDYLRRLDIGFCAVDEPALPGLLPPRAAVTSDAGYVRFHGRNAATWWGGGHERYDWEYTAEELSEWLDRIREMATATDRTYVFFNNCYMGRAVKSARLLERLLGLEPELDLGF